MWKVGDKALCIDDSNQDNPSIVYNKEDYVKKGIIYLVREYTYNEYTKSKHGLYLQGHCAGYWSNGIETPYKATRFRKIVPVCDKKIEELANKK